MSTKNNSAGIEFEDFNTNKKSQITTSDILNSIKHGLKIIANKQVPKGLNFM